MKIRKEMEGICRGGTEERCMTQQACACVSALQCSSKEMAAIKESKQKVTLFCEQAQKALRQFKQAEKKIKTNSQYSWAESKLKGSVKETETQLSEKAPCIIHLSPQHPPLPKTPPTRAPHRLCCFLANQEGWLEDDDDTLKWKPQEYLKKDLAASGAQICGALREAVGEE